MNAAPPDSVLARLRRLAPSRPLTRSEARWLADRQAATLLRLAGITAAPVPLTIITNLPRMSVEYVPDLPTAGLSYWKDGRWHLCATAGDHPRRQRYSIAHEFKHVLDHPDRHYLYSRVPEQAERIAEAFAAALLMPRLLVKRAYYLGIRDARDLARLFQVSPSAMRIRLEELGLTDPVVSARQQGVLA